MKNSMKLLGFSSVLLVLWFVVSCEKDQIPSRSDTSAIDTIPTTDTIPATDTIPTGDDTTSSIVFPPECYGDSVWLSNLDGVLTICCRPFGSESTMDSGWFYCFSEFANGYGAGPLLFMNDYYYKYIYCEDGSDTVLLRSLGFNSYEIDYITSQPHLAITHCVKNGETDTTNMMLGIQGIVYLVWDVDTFYKGIKLYELASTHQIENEFLKSFRFLHTILNNK